jgi:hypothetical protein
MVHEFRPSGFGEAVLAFVLRATLKLLLKPVFSTALLDRVPAALAGRPVENRHRDARRRRHGGHGGWCPG